ncbi:hypothetical protein QJS04_geneDACA015962 [Acorus gramineus]|uniref:SCP domain-containing protein n=1 Tax=Acorus gramineus TaxID=55184 RepID=A0AAV9BF22_ACOGR|nr:hypothetical protein QJS04_geneDACA015962 [Acorus gramineus]
MFMMVHTSQAQNSPQDFLDAHNSARAQVGVGPMSWNDTVAAYAQNYANQRASDCQLVHSKGSYGENLYGGGTTSTFNAVDAVKSWVDESQYYDYNSNTCADEAPYGCLHYTQVVWRDSVQLGCARVVCSTGGVFIICSYSPPGNYVGQKPY